MIDLAGFGALPVRILVVKLSSMGDLIHVTGSLRALRLALPAAHITLATESRWADVVRHNPNLNELILSSIQERISAAYLAEIYGHLSNLEKFDIAIDLQGNRRSAAWIYLSLARLKLGRGGFRPGWRFVATPDLTRHAVEVCSEICRGIGVNASGMDPEIYTSRTDEDSLDEVLEAQAAPRTGYVLINPFSRWVSKSWPEQNAAEVIRRLVQFSDTHLILTGGPEDRPRGESLCSLLPPGTLTSLVGRLSLGQALCLFRRARLMVTCDSGPMHAAAAFGVPVVALFGPTHPERTGPWGPDHCVLQTLRPPTHHAYRTDRRAMYMSALDSDLIFNAVVAKLHSTQAGAMNATNENRTGT